MNGEIRELHDDVRRMSDKLTAAQARIAELERMLSEAVEAHAKVEQRADEIDRVPRSSLAVLSDAEWWARYGSEEDELHAAAVRQWLDTLT